jgi:hypothetical protein
MARKRIRKWIGKRLAREPKPVPFVVGVSRSGTTLLRFMLDAHPQLAIPPETHFLPELIAECRRDGATPDSAADLVTSHRRFGDFGMDPDELRRRFRRAGVRPVGGLVRSFYELYAEGQGKRRWGDKTPNYIQYMRKIGRVIPEARFIHLIRDGRDTALSRASRALDKPAPVGFLAKRWKRRIGRARTAARKLSHYTEIRYEDLVLDTEGTLRRICEFLELPFHPAMLDYHERAEDRLGEMARDLPAERGKAERSAEHRIAGHTLVTEPPRADRLARWKTEMSEEDRRRFEQFAGELLEELGYEVGDGVDRRTRPNGRGSAPFVVGVTRSGTTLLRLMLDAHPQLAIPPETHFLPDLIAAAGERGASPESLAEVIVGDRHWGDFDLDADELRRRVGALESADPGEAARTFYRLYAEREGKPRWGDKTPQYLKSMASIQAVIPEARFVHLIRDGRDAALSRATRVLKDPPPQADVARRWKKRVLRAREDAAKLDHYLEARYEDLVTDPEATLRRICEFLDLEFDPAMLTYHERAEERLGEMARDLPERPGQPLRPADHRLEAHALTKEPPRSDRVARWRTQMSEDDQAAWAETAGDLLAELGYEVPGGAA